MCTNRKAFLLNYLKSSTYFGSSEGIMTRVERVGKRLDEGSGGRQGNEFDGGKTLKRIVFLQDRNCKNAKSFQAVRWKTFGITEFLFLQIETPKIEFQFSRQSF